MSWICCEVLTCAEFVGERPEVGLLPGPEVTEGGGGGHRGRLVEAALVPMAGAGCVIEEGRPGAGNNNPELRRIPQPEEAIW